MEGISQLYNEALRRLRGNDLGATNLDKTISAPPMLKFSHKGLRDD